MKNPILDIIDGVDSIGDAGSFSLPMNTPVLEKIDHSQFERLTAQESFTILGQARKIDLIEQLITERVKAHLGHEVAVVTEELLSKGETSSEDEIHKLADSRLQKLDIQEIRFSDKRRNLIVGKGSGRSAAYTIMIPAHVDTFRLKKKSFPKELLTLQQDPLESDRMRGHGVWDMGAAVLNNVALAADVRVPDGMQIYFVFTVDEEADSIGAKAMIKHWPAWHDVDLVLSSEIGPLSDIPGEGDTAMRYILARRGRRKMRGRIKIAKEYRGHGAVSNVPNAREALYEWAHYAKQRFNESVMVGGKVLPPLQKKHPLLPEEKLDFGGGKTLGKPEGQGHPNLEEFDLHVQTVPPSTLASVLADQIAVFNELKQRGEWARYGISNRLRSFPGTSYPPYSMPIDLGTGVPLPHTAVTIVQNILRNVSGMEPVAAGANSNADECLYAHAMLKALEEKTGTYTFEGTNKGVITLPIIGNKAHNLREWVSWSDTARVRQALKMLIEDPSGFCLLGGKRQNSA